MISCFLKQNSLKNNNIVKSQKMLFRNLKNIKLITFDYTNTLLYYKNPAEKQYLITAAENGFHKEDFNPDLMSKSFKKYFKDLNNEYLNFGTSTIGYLKCWEKVISDIKCPSPL